MIVYLDASALVKRYVAEQGSEEVNRLVRGADSVVTNLISRAEVAAAVMRASRIGIISVADAGKAVAQFRSEWGSLQRLPVTEATVERADRLVGHHDLRGYDAVHMAAALMWQEAMNEPIVMATFDKTLWGVSHDLGLEPWPESL